MLNDLGVVSAPWRDRAHERFRASQNPLHHNYKRHNNRERRPRTNLGVVENIDWDRLTGLRINLWPIIERPNQVHSVNHLPRLSVHHINFQPITTRTKLFVAKCTPGQNLRPLPNQILFRRSLSSTPGFVPNSLRIQRSGQKSSGRSYTSGSWNIPQLFTKIVVPAGILKPRY